MMPVAEFVHDVPVIKPSGAPALLRPLLANVPPMLPRPANVPASTRTFAPQRVRSQGWRCRWSG